MHHPKSLSFFLSLLFPFLSLERVVSSAPDNEDDPSKPTCACWVGNRANCFAVGYDDGSILVWGVPPTALNVNPAKVTASQDALLIMSLRVATEGVPAAPVRSMAFLPGTEGTPGGEDCLLVCGGQPESDPEMLTLMPLDSEIGTPPKTVPWFGTIKAYALLPRPGAITNCEPEALMVLTEGGQLVVHDLTDWQPSPLTLPLQELPPITTSLFVPALSKDQAAALTAQGPSGVQHALTLPALWGVANNHRVLSARGHQLGDWPFTAGEPAPNEPEALAAGCHPSAVLMTGHRDGKVRVWDSTAQVPVLLMTIPSSAAAGIERLKPVSSIDVCSVSGLLVIGHSSGDVKVYQFSDRPQAVRRASLDESLVPYDNLLAQPAGFQYILKYSTHSSDITSVRIASKLGVLAVGDASGAVSAIDLSTPQRLFQTIPVVGQAVAKLEVASASAPSKNAEMTLPGSASPSPRGREEVYIFVASADSSITMVGLYSGEPAAKTLRPKNASKTLDLALLDAQGVPLMLLQGSVFLHWADNNALTPPRSLQMMAVSRREGSLSAQRRSSGVGRGDDYSTHSSASGSNALPPIATGGRQSTGGAEGVYSPGGVSIGGRTTSVEVRALPDESDEEDEELDAALGAAAAAADARDSGKQRFSIFRRRSPSPEKKGATSGRSTDTPSNSPFINTGGAGQQQQQRSVSPMGHFSPPRQSQELGPLALANATATTASPTLSPGRALPTASPHSYTDTAYSPQYPASQYQPPPYPSQQYTSPHDTVEDDYGVDTEADLWGGLYKDTTKSNTGAGVKSPSNLNVMDYPYMDCGLEDSNSSPPASAEFVLLATSGHLRIYSAESVRHADRISNRKTRLDPGTVFAGVFLSEMGPGVVSVSSEGTISVHSVPNLALLLTKPLASHDALGYPWRASSDESSSGAWTCSLEGQLLLTAPGNELSRLSVIRDTVPPLGAQSTFDWELAKAARAAAAKATGSEKTSRAASMDVPSPGGNTNNFLSQVKGAAAAASGAVMQEIEKVRAGILPPRELPTLRTLFEREVESLIIDDDDIDYIREDDDGEEGGADLKDSNKVTAAGAAAAVAAVAVAGKAADKAKDLASAAFQGAATGGAKLKSMLPGRRPSGDEIDDQLVKAAAARDRRNELLGTASGNSMNNPINSATASGRKSPPPASYSSAATSRASSSSAGAGGRHVRRTTSEIRRTYGHTRAQDARTTMERNKQMLAERGEKLANLEEKSAAMRGDAEDFAGLAAELEAHFNNRKWWQF